MRISTITFFCNRRNDKGPKAHFDYSQGTGYTLKISPYQDTPYADPYITFFLDSESDIIAFKNSVIQAYEKYLRKKEGGENVH